MNMKIFCLELRTSALLMWQSGQNGEILPSILQLITYSTIHFRTTRILQALHSTKSSPNKRPTLSTVESWSVSRTSSSTGTKLLTPFTLVHMSLLGSLPGECRDDFRRLLPPSSWFSCLDSSMTLITALYTETIFLCIFVPFNYKKDQ